MMSSGAGALIGTMFLAPLTQAARRTGLLLGGAIAWVGLWLILFSEVSWLPLSLLSLFFVSMGIPTVLTTTMGLMQVLAPTEMRARLMSLFFTLSFGMQPFASLLAGYMADTLTTPVAIRVNGLLLLLGAILIMAVRPALRRCTRRRLTALQPRVQSAQARLRPRASRPDRPPRPSDELFLPQRPCDERRGRLSAACLARAAALATIRLGARRGDDHPQRLFAHHARRALGK